MGEDTLSPEVLAAAITGLKNLPPIDRANAVPDLIHQAMATLAAVRAEAIAEAEAGGMRRADIARRLGISRQQITKIIGARPRATAPA